MGHHTRTDLSQSHPPPTIPRISNDRVQLRPFIVETQGKDRPGALLDETATPLVAGSLRPVRPYPNSSTPFSVRPSAQGSQTMKFPGRRRLGFPQGYPRFDEDRPFPVPWVVASRTPFPSPVKRPFAPGPAPSLDPPVPSRPRRGNWNPPADNVPFAVDPPMPPKQRHSQGLRHPRSRGGT